MPMTNQTMNHLGTRLHCLACPHRFKIDLIVEHGMIRLRPCSRSRVGCAATAATSLSSLSIVASLLDAGCDKPHHGRRLPFCQGQLNGIEVKDAPPKISHSDDPGASPLKLFCRNGTDLAEALD